jgi:uroporphyrinogen-III decarboxylase
VYDHLLELPKGSVVAMLEADDMIQAKKDIGDKVALCGGMRAELLRDGTKQQNIDAVRRIIDECGMEGIMMAQTPCLLSPGDVNPDNIKAGCEFVRDYRP